VSKAAAFVGKAERSDSVPLSWLTLGNQLGSDQIYEEDLALRIKTKYALSLFFDSGI